VENQDIGGDPVTGLGDYDGVPAYALFTGQTCFENGMFEISSFEDDAFAQTMADYAEMRNLTTGQAISELLRVGLSVIMVNIADGFPPDDPDMAKVGTQCRILGEQVTANIIRDMIPKWRAVRDASANGGRHVNGHD
jgi:hypothetical protein